MYEPPLKDHSLTEIEEAIALALTNLCGQPIAINLSSFVVDRTDLIRWTVKMDMSAKEGKFVGPPEHDGWTF